MDDKWLTSLAASVQGELDRVSQALTGRIRQLADRYAVPLPDLLNEVQGVSRAGRWTFAADGIPLVKTDVDKQ